ncbi:hypothetical protein EV360DRAFT_58345 [Lentinula raphanica]|nr:hypothetical protein EV360DRAFT_58345 [Lentinula raphanica]
MRQCRTLSSFSKTQLHGRRSDFASWTVGFGYGNGRSKPQNFKVTGKANQAAAMELLSHRSIRRIAGFQSSLFNVLNHKNYCEHMQTNSELQRLQPELQLNFPHLPFAALTFNLGPQSWSLPHMDADNLASSWCADTNVGSFDPDKGGQLILWDFGIIIRFPPGATILFPSALVTHSTMPIEPHESCYVLIQYSSGELFHWRSNGFQSDKDFLRNASPEQVRAWHAKRASQWKTTLQKFTYWDDLVRGDWRGVVRTEAGLDELSELSELEDAEDLTPPVQKRTRCH